MIRLHVRVTPTLMSCSRFYVSNDNMHVGACRSASQTTSSVSKSAPSMKASCSSSAPSNPPSYLYRSFMGHSTRFAAMNPPLTRAAITRLEREPLTHSTPSRVNDHICIGMVKTLRWLADRAFRERYIHRATMLVTVASAAPAAGCVAAYLRMFFKRSNSNNHCTWDSKVSATAEVSSPFLAFGNSVGAGSTPPIPGPYHSFDTERPPLYMSTSSAAEEGRRLKREHFYDDELRGLFTQCESHAVHSHVLSCMAEITLLERCLVLLLQTVHFTVYLALFLSYPRMGFRLMAYTAEESSVVWTQMVNDIDLGKIAERRVPRLALHHWGLEGVFTAQEAPTPLTVTPQGQGPARCSSSGRAVAEGVSAAEAPTLDASSYSINDGNQAVTPPSRAVDHASLPLAASGPCDDNAIDRNMNKECAFTTSNDGIAVGLSVLTLRDVALLIRSDEMIFRDLNHELADKLDMQPSWMQRLVASLGGGK